ncbi:MAG: amidohydrolase/deacetylase family metallohydrolase [Alphaproteobacteria bacterium]|nr:amidohydrolase/deacetylase family metallohydrolase [Alphaproteobacteria bacterium]
MTPTQPLLLRNAKLVGFGAARGSDVLIGADGKVAAAGPALAAPSGAESLDLAGAFLSPGWTDLHTHVYWGGTDISVRPRDIGAAAGVATLVDAGSAGEANFHGFREYVAQPAAERIVAFLNLGSIGLVACNRISELADHRSVNIDRMLACIEANKDIIRGVKIRASVTVLGSWGITPVKIARKVAKIAGLPIMVHVGEPPPMIEEVFALLQPGDIVTHCFHGKRGANIMEDADLADWAKRLADQGVVMDIGHGAASFSYAVGMAGLKHGIVPTTISTDLHVRNFDGPVWELSLVMSKLLALGMRFDDVIAGVTTNALKAVALPHENLIAIGAEARFTAFDLVDCDLTLPDSQKNPLRITRRFLPRHTIIGRSVVAAGSRYRG